jgi:general secretion pathway protein H
MGRTGFPAAKVKTPTSLIDRLRDDKAAAGAEQGFSLLELVAVLALLALFLGLVVPGLYRSWERERVRASLRDLMLALRAARSVAATQHQRIRVFLDLETGAYRLEGSSRGGQWPAGMRLADAHLVWQNPEKRQGYIAFYGDGSSSGGYLALVDPAGRRYSLDVEIITGKVTLKGGGG